MQDIEKNFYELCKKYNNQAENDYKGFLLYKVLKSQKYNEELLSAYIMPKPKFDSIYAVVLTNSRIIEVNIYSTMYIISIIKFNDISKVIVEYEYDDNKVKELLKDEAIPEKVNLKVQFVNSLNQIEEVAWKNIEDEDGILQIVEFADKLKELQVDNLSKG